MILPESGRVVIIDDKFGEVLPLIRILSRERVAVTYFSGKEKELPDEPFTDVRIVFLDIVLEGVDPLDDKTIISTLTNVVGRIVSKENGPFVLAVWTKEPKKVELIKNALRKAGYYFIVVDLEKNLFFSKDDNEWCIKKSEIKELETKLKEEPGEVDIFNFFREKEDGEWVFMEDQIGELEKDLGKKLREMDIFKVFIQWENVVHEATSETVNEVSKFSEYNENWNNEMKKIFYNLAKAWLGKLIEETGNDEKVRGAFYTFHRIFVDILEKRLKRMDIPDIEFKKEDLEDQIKGRINSYILIEKIHRDDIYPGNVYKTEKEIQDISDLIDDCFNNNEEIKEELTKVSIPVIVEVSPVCDLVQQKIRKYRYVSGLLCPKSFKVDGREVCVKNKLKRSALFLYITPIIQYNEDPFILILNFKYFSSADEDFFSKKEFLFRIRKELLSDIQIKLASHINRTGVLYL